MLDLIRKAPPSTTKQQLATELGVSRKATSWLMTEEEIFSTAYLSLKKSSFLYRGVNQALPKLTTFRVPSVLQSPPSPRSRMQGYKWSQLYICFSWLVSLCFEPGEPQRITSGLNKNFTLSPCYSFHKSSYHKSCFWSLFIFCGHSTWEPASSKVTYFILRAYKGTMC